MTDADLRALAEAATKLPWVLGPDDPKEPDFGSIKSRILAIDPGPTQSAFVVLDEDGNPDDFTILPNAELLDLLRSGDGSDGLAGDHRAIVVIEEIASYGMPVGREVFQTVRWAGRFEEAARPAEVHYLPRLAVKSHICHSAKANDATIRQALIDRFTTDTQPAIGLKANPGPLYRIKADLWAALAVAVTWSEQHAEGGR